MKTKKSDNTAGEESTADAGAARPGGTEANGRWPLLVRLERKLSAGAAMLLAAGLFQVLALLYAPAFRSPFLYDDLPNIVFNEDFRIPGVPEALGRVLGAHEASTHYDRRPVSGVVTWLNYRWSGLEVTGYRAVNLLIHWATALLAGVAVWLLARAVMRRSGSGAGEGGDPGSGTQPLPRLLAVGTALLWAVHPIHATAVIYINQRQETLMSLFFLASCVGLLMAGERPARQGRWRVLAGVVALLSLFSKENAAGLLIVLAVLDRLYVAGSWREMGKHHRLFWGGLTVLWVAALGWIATGVRLHEWDAIPALASPWAYFQTECRVVYQYVRTVFWPDPLIFAPVPKIAERWQDWVPYGLALVALFGAVAVAARRRVWLWIPWLVFLLVLGPTSSFIPVPLEPDFDYRMHLPALPVIALVLMGVYRLAGALAGKAGQQGAAGQEAAAPKGGKRYALPVLAGGGMAVLVALSAVTRARAKDFARPETIWLDTVEKEPVNMKAWLNLAWILNDQGRMDEVRRAVGALENVNGLLKLPWVGGECRKLTAMLAMADQNWALAEEEYRKASVILPDRPDLALGSARALLEQGKPQEALTMLGSTGGMGRGTGSGLTDPMAALCRARALLALGRRGEAEAAALPVETWAFPLSPEVSAERERWRQARSGPREGR